MPARIPRPVRTPDPPPPFATALTTSESTTALSFALAPLHQRCDLNAAAQPSATDLVNDNPIQAPHCVSSCPADPGLSTTAMHH